MTWKWYGTFIRWTKSLNWPTLCTIMGLCLVWMCWVLMLMPDFDMTSFPWCFVKSSLYEENWIDSLCETCHISNDMQFEHFDCIFTTSFLFVSQNNSDVFYQSIILNHSMHPFYMKSPPTIVTYDVDIQFKW